MRDALGRRCTLIRHEGHWPVHTARAASSCAHAAVCQAQAGQGRRRAPQRSSARSGKGPAATEKRAVRFQQRVIGSDWHRMPTFSSFADAESCLADAPCRRTSSAVACLSRSFAAFRSASAAVCRKYRPSNESAAVNSSRCFVMASALLASVEGVWGHKAAISLLLRLLQGWCCRDRASCSTCKWSAA